MPDPVTRERIATAKPRAANTCRLMAAHALNQIRSAPPEKRLAIVRRARVWLMLANESDGHRPRQQSR